VIDVVVILNALRALNPAHGHVRRTIPAAVGREMHHDHVALIRDLDRLRSVADELDDVAPETAAVLIVEANAVVQEQVVEHERDDEGSVYPRLATVLMDGHGLSAMSRAHREILHLARLLARVVEDLPSEKIDRYLVRDAQRVIESIECLGAHTRGAGRGYLRGRRGTLKGIGADGTLAKMLISRKLSRVASRPHIIPQFCQKKCKTLCCDGWANVILRFLPSKTSRRSRRRLHHLHPLIRALMPLLTGLSKACARPGCRRNDRSVIFL
jgi:hypothetical protein